VAGLSTHNPDASAILAETPNGALSISLVAISGYSDASPCSAKRFGTPANVVRTGAKCDHLSNAVITWTGPSELHVALPV